MLSCERGDRPALDLGRLARVVIALADPDERFELLLDIFVDGLARRAAAA